MAATPKKADRSGRGNDLQTSLAKVATAAVIIVALTFQFQPTLTVGELKLRVGLSDMVVLLLLPAFVLLFAEKQRELRQLLTPYLVVPIAAATIAMTYGLLIGFVESDGVISWALVKYIGWYSLLYYAFIGIVLAAYDPPRLPRIFVIAFVSGLSVIIVTYLVISSLGMYWTSHSGVRLTGFFPNANAFGLALVCGIALVVASDEAFSWGRRKFSREPLVALLCAGLLFTRSIAAALALVVLVLCFLMVRRQYLPTLRIGLMASVIYFIPGTVYKLITQFERFVQHLPPRMGLPGRFGIAEKIGGVVFDSQNINGNVYGLTLNARLESNAKALSAWLEQPILGIGLGSFWERQQQTGNAEQTAMVIHNTALWLLTEFGVLGLVVFACLFVSFGLFLYRAMRRLGEQDQPRADFIFAGLLIMAGWAAMSLAHEMMYQRIPWFILGLCAGVALAPRASKEGSS
ncbi:MAG: O-antigen ligase family protein [Hyphomicrobiaceae bacterium]